MYWAAQDPTMPTPLQLICTDFDGTLHSDFTEPPVPQALQAKLAQLQAEGATWVINKDHQRRWVEFFTTHFQ